MVLGSWLSVKRSNHPFLLALNHQSSTPWLLNFVFVRYALAHDEADAAFHLALGQRILAALVLPFSFLTRRRLLELGPAHGGRRSAASLPKVLDFFGGPRLH